MQTLDKEKGIENNDLLATADRRDELKQFDLQVLYLRRVHSYCYFTNGSYHDERMLVAKCGVIYLRTSLSEQDIDAPEGEGSDWDQLVTS